MTVHFTFSNNTNRSSTARMCSTQGQQKRSYSAPAMLLHYTPLCLPIHAETSNRSRSRAPPTPRCRPSLRHGARFDLRTPASSGYKPVSDKQLDAATRPRLVEKSPLCLSPQSIYYCAWQRAGEACYARGGRPVGCDSLEGRLGPGWL